MKRITAILLCLIVFFTVCFVGCTDNEAGENDDKAQTDQSTDEKKDKKLTEDTVFTRFTATDLEGNTYDESVLKEKKLTMINLWIPYVPTCLTNLSDFNELGNEYDDLQVIGFVCGLYENEDGTYSSSVLQDALKVIDEEKLSFLNLLPYEDLKELKLTGDYSVPQVIFVDENGKQIGESVIGTKTHDEWKAIIEDALDSVK